MSQPAEKPPTWAWFVGAAVIVIFVIGLLQLLDWIFSLPVLVLTIVGVGGYLWYRGRQSASV